MKFQAENKSYKKKTKLICQVLTVRTRASGTGRGFGRPDPGLILYNVERLHCYLGRGAKDQGRECGLFQLL